MSEYNYNEDLKINSNLLESDLENQPLLFMKYAILHADALVEKDRLKQRVELIYTELDALLRSDWQSYFNKRPTEVQIKNWISVHPKYVKAQGLYAKSCRDVHITGSAKEAFAQRRFILGNIVSMKLSGIYANPKVETKRIAKAPEQAPKFNPFKKRN